MFTGLIEAIGTVVQRQAVGEGARLHVAIAWPDAAATQLGDSIAVNGCCLTAVAVRPLAPDEVLTFDLSHETLRLTAFGEVAVGTAVNAERAARLGDRLGGHLVTGHVDGVGQRMAVVERGGAWDVAYAVPPDAECELVVKGSVAIDGVSLTVNALSPGQVHVTLVAHTAAHTQLLAGPDGKAVHFETDLVAKHVRRLVELGFSPRNG